MQETVARLPAKSADIKLVADSAVSTWRAVDAALSPIIGQRGVAALFKRSLFLIRADHPWLAAIYVGGLPPDDFESLRFALMQHSSSNAIAANAALLKSFHDLLAHLIGASLTERLLQSIWPLPSSGAAAQDT